VLIELHRTITELPLINYFTEAEQDLDRVLNIFIRVNSGGTTLSYSDLLLSNPKPFVWTSDADLIPGKVARLSK
jgi:hypothetical protein